MTRCIRASSLGQRNNCRPGSTERPSLSPRDYRAISVDKANVAGSGERHGNTQLCQGHDALSPPCHAPACRGLSPPSPIGLSRPWILPSDLGKGVESRV